MTADQRFYDVYLPDPQTGRPIVVRMSPTDWDTAVADYHRRRERDFVMTMYEVTASGDVIREITREEIQNNQPEGIQA